MTTETPEQQRMIDEAVNTKGFLEFMSAHTKSIPEDINDPKLVAERFETFKRKEEVRTEVLGIFGDQIKKDFDISLDARDKESIGAYIDKQAIEDPKKIETLRELIGLFRTLPNQIASLTGQIKNLGTTSEQNAKQRELESDLEKMESVKEGNRGFGINRLLHRFFPKKWGANKEVVENTQDLVGKHGAEIKSSEGFDKVTNKIKAQIAEIEKNLELTGKLEDAKSKFDSARNMLLGEASSIKELTDVIQKKFESAFKLMLARASKVEQLVETQKRYEKYKTTESDTNIKPLALINDENYQTELDQVSENLLYDEISDVVSGFDTSQGSFPKRLEAALEPYLKMDKLGTADQETTHRFVVESLEDIYDRLPINNETMIKRMILARIIFKAKRT